MFKGKITQIENVNIVIKNLWTYVYRKQKVINYINYNIIRKII